MKESKKNDQVIDVRCPSCFRIWQTDATEDCAAQKGCVDCKAGLDTRGMVYQQLYYLDTMYMADAAKALQKILSYVLGELEKIR